MTTPAYQAAVDDKVRLAARLIEAGIQADGWSQGPRRIIEEAVDECVDAGGWPRGLDQYDVPDDVLAHVERGIECAAEAYTELQQALRRLDR